MSAALQFIYSPSPATERGKAVSITADPKGVNVLYCIGNSVVIRNIKDPKVADIYSEHSHATTVAKYAPSGFYIASGDVSGTLKIWDTTQKEHPLKIELRVLGGPIRDLAWSPDNQRIIIVGDGKERFGAAILWDSGASVGEISGHSKQIYSCDFKPTRPYKAITASEDFLVNWFEGPPFKFNKSFKDHTRFVNCVRFSPDGNLAVSVGSDKLGFFYREVPSADPKVKPWERKGALPEGEKGHAGGIYAASWAPDSKSLVTASADKTIKVWSVAVPADPNAPITLTNERTHKADDKIENQQLGVLWQGDTILSVNLNGDILEFAAGSLDQPRRVIRGHNKFITALAHDGAADHFYTGSYDGNILQWEVKTGAAVPMVGQGHTNQITDIKLQGDRLVTIAMDDSVRFTPKASRHYGESISLDSPPAAVAVGKKDLVVVATMKSVYVIRGSKVVHQSAVNFQPSAVALSINENEVVVGGKDNSLRLYKLNGDSLSESKKLEGHRGPLSVIAFSPDGHYLASGDHNREIIVWDTASYSSKITGWVFHTSRVNTLAWAPTSKHVVSGSLDKDLYVWSVDAPEKRIRVQNAHAGGVNAALWIDGNTLASAGQDCALKTWSVKF